MTSQTPEDIQNILNEEAPRRRRGISLGSLVLLVGVIMAVGTVGWAYLEQTRAQPTHGNAPEFTLTTFDGEPFSLAEHRGNIVILNFWGSWCAPCREEAPDLERIHQRYHDRGVVLLGVTYAESSQQDSLDFIEEFGLTYTNAPDERTHVADRYRIRGVPETFVIDRDGQIADGGFFSGPVNEALLSELLDRLLAEESQS